MKYCKDCMEYSCGAQGSDGISQTCGDSGTYFHRTELPKIKLRLRSCTTESEEKRTMQIDTVLNDILDEIDRLRDALMSTRVPPDVALQYKNTAYGLDYAECIIMKYKNNAINNKKEEV